MARLHRSTAAATSSAAELPRELEDARVLADGLQRLAVAGLVEARHARGDPWLAVHSVGFGATSIAVRSAPAPEGPWSPACAVFTPPDSTKPTVLVYAAKAHPELLGGSLVATYATNSTDLATLANDMSVYFPRFVRVP